MRPPRVEPLVPTQSELSEQAEAINQGFRSRRFRSRVVSDVDAELEAIRGVYGAGIVDLRRWLAHPDERVVLALLRRSSAWADRHDEFVRCWALVRGIETWVREQAWNPVLDTITGRGWPAAVALKEWEKREKRAAPREAWTSDRKLLHAVTAAVAESDEQALWFERTLHCISPSFHRAVAQGIHTPTDTMLDAAAKAGHRTKCLWTGLLNAPGLSPEQATRQLERVVAGLMDRSVGVTQTGTLCAGLTVLHRKTGGSLSDEQFSAILEPFLAGGRAVSRFTSGRRVVQSLLSQDGVGSDDVLMSLYDALGSRDWVVNALLWRTRLPAGLLRRMSVEVTEPGLRARVARKVSSEGLVDEETWDGLSRSRAEDVQTLTLQHGIGSGFRRVFLRALRGDQPGRALQALLDRFDEVGHVISADDITARLTWTEETVARYARIVVRLAVADLPASEMPAAFRTLARLRPRDASHVLCILPRDRRRLLSRDDVAPLLVAPDRDVRLQAVSRLRDVLGFRVAATGQRPMRKERVPKIR